MAVVWLPVWQPVLQNLFQLRRVLISACQGNKQRNSSFPDRRAVAADKNRSHILQDKNGWVGGKRLSIKDRSDAHILAKHACATASFKQRVLLSGLLLP